MDNSNPVAEDCCFNTSGPVSSSSGSVGGGPKTIEEKRALQEAAIALRNKKFAELTDSQKIDRLLEAVRNMRYWPSRVSQLESRLRQFETHQHGIDGKAMLPTQNIFSGGMECGSVGSSMMDPLA